MLLHNSWTISIAIRGSATPSNVTFKLTLSRHNSRYLETTPHLSLNFCLLWRVTNFYTTHLTTEASHLASQLGDERRYPVVLRTATRVDLLSVTVAEAIPRNVERRVRYENIEARRRRRRKLYTSQSANVHRMSSEATETEFQSYKKNIRQSLILVYLNLLTPARVFSRNW